MTPKEVKSGNNGDERYGLLFRLKISAARTAYFAAHPEARGEISERAKLVHAQRPWLKDASRDGAKKAWEDDGYRQAVSSKISARMRTFCHDPQYQEEWNKRKEKMTKGRKNRAKIKPLYELVLETLEVAHEIFPYYGKPNLLEVYRKGCRQMPEGSKNLEFLQIFYASKVASLEAPLMKKREDGKAHPGIDMKYIAEIYEILDLEIFERLRAETAFIMQQTIPKSGVIFSKTDGIGRMSRVRDFYSFAGISSDY